MENIMMTTTLTNKDLQLRDRVMRQLAWDTQVDASDIGVSVRDDVATLTGFVGTYADKLAAERATKRVRGVRAVADDIQVRLRLTRTDPDIAADAANALALRTALPSVQAVVRGGHITLTGTVRTLFQRHVAEKAVTHIKGAVAVVNHIRVLPATTPRDVAREIVRALHREADTNARGVKVSVDGSSVVLTGQVDTWHERESAERAAMHAEGITHVENLIVISPRLVFEFDEEEI
jgi:osmotically-inducible protein OsmY